MQRYSTAQRVWTLSVAALCLIVLPPPLRAAASRPAGPDIRRDAVVEAVERVMPSVVNIATEEIVPVRDPLDNIFREFFDPYYRRRQPNTQFSLGSGVIIDEEGFVLTSFHVVNRARRVWVKFSDGREYEAEKIVGTSFTDLALLRIKAKEGDKFAAVKFAGDDDLLLGETVLALGNPFGLGGSVSRGILSSKSRRPAAENEPMDVPDWLQSDAAINPGNSGGPLINLRGELIGINVAIYREGQGIGFAIPVKRIVAAISELYSPEWLEKMWFGARLRPGASPLQVMSIQPESPADDAGLRVGDRILQLAGHAPKSFIEFNRELLKRKHDEVTLRIQRGDEQRTLKLRLLPEKAFFNADLVRKKIGVTLDPASGASAADLGLGRTQGRVITEVDPRSPAAQAQVQPGMILTAIDGQAIDDIVSAAKALYAKAKGQKTKLELIVPARRGPFLQLSQVAVEVTVR
jgi:S1-C subfamily serine protease